MDTITDSGKVATNHCRRNLLSWDDLSARQKKEFDDSVHEGSDRFFTYKGWAYSLDEFMRVDESSSLRPNWDGYLAETWFSGVLVKIVDNGESVVVGSIKY